jgi:CRISPR-associated endonuclease/helicase Cas3
MKKQEKLVLIENLLLSHPVGITRTEIASALGVHRSTIGRCIDDLSLYIPIIEDDNKKLTVNKSEYLNNIKLTLHEVFALYLASRLLFLTFNLYSPHIYSSLSKLAASLTRVSPLLGDFIHASAEYLLSQAHTEWKAKIDILEKLTIAWAENRKILIHYHSKKTSELHTYTASIYFIEPYPAGRTIYVFAATDEEAGFRTLRSDRIVKAEMTAESYTIPADFSFKNLFADAWGIWGSGGKAAQVVLKFSARVAERVKETVWHPSQKIICDKAGGLRFMASISEPLEMVPWIRGWGSDCEVLKPVSLRELMKEEAKKLGKMYG